MKKIVFNILVLLMVVISLPGQNSAVSKGQSFKFVSFPDFFNFDIPNPWAGYDTAVDYFLKRVKDENPSFVLIDGDLVNGHWWNNPQCVKHMGTIYYSGWVRRMQQYGLTYYTAIGDHELGDDPWPKEKVALVPYLEDVYRQNLNMPVNGPSNKKGLAYYIRQGDLLVITVETFEVIGDSMHIDVMGEQLEWFKQVLKENDDAKFKIVQGHVGIWGTLKSRSSSNLMLNNGKESDFYKVMKESGVDAYLAGEFHDVTILESDGIWQIVHGSSWGREIVNTEDYLVGEVSGDELNLTMKRIYMDAQGEYMFNLNKDKGPREIVKINDKTLKNGPETIGTLTIKKNKKEKVYLNNTGVFNQN